MATTLTRIENFGRNVVFDAQVLAPENEQHLLEILQEHRGKRIRARGSLHSWSQTVCAEEVLLDMTAFNTVTLKRGEDDEDVAQIGGGCQIKKALAELDRRGKTLPAIGLISEQTIAGAAATGTHGSGKRSLSHYLTGVKIAHYDSRTGQPVCRWVREGDELLAARCSLGCLGIVVAVEVPPVSQYLIEEWLQWHEEDDLGVLLEGESQTPLQQFYLMPWSWKFLVQHRRVAGERTKRSWNAPLYRAYWFLTVDVALHVILCLLVQTLRSRTLVKAFFRRIIPWTLPRHWPVMDWSHKMLIMEHELFRHVEIEVFVKRGQLPAALEFARRILQYTDGEEAALDAALRKRLQQNGLFALCEAARGYSHHYPICVRRILPDQTLISMASREDGEDFYALSFISYARPNSQDRTSFENFAAFLARSMAKLFDARCHWGKVCPTPAAEVDRLYPHLPRFRAVCRRFDPTGVFRNQWIDGLLFSEELQNLPVGARTEVGQDFLDTATPTADRGPADEDSSS